MSTGRVAGVDGTRAWLIAVAGLVANAACWGTLNSFGAFLDSMTEEFNSGLGATALIYALPSFVLFMLGMLTGPLAEQFGPRRMLLGGAAFIGVGLALTARATSLVVAIVAYGLGVGLGMACFLVPMTACIGGWFVRRRALAQGLSAAGSGLGTLIMVPLARRLIENYGWRRSYEVLGAICVAALTGAAVVAARPPQSVSPGRPSLQRIRRAAAAGPFLQVYVGGFLMSSAMFVPFAFLVRYATDHGITARNAVLLLSVLGAANTISRLVLTAVAGRAGAVRLYLLCVALLPLGLGLWMVAGDSYLVLAVFAAVLGVSQGGYVALSPEVTAQLFGVHNLGTVLGALWTAPGIGALTSPVVAGVLIDTGGYGITIAVALALALVAVLSQRSLWGSPAPLPIR